MSASFLGEFDCGRYTGEEIERILEINARGPQFAKPENAFYTKSALENGPSWAEKREFVHFLINESNISLSSKKYLRECDHWVPKYQLRGLKYGLVASAGTYFFFPVIRRQPFLTRFTCAMVPMAYFMRWGYVWGHQHWWRRAKEIVVTYEIFVGTRSRFTMK